MEGFFILSVCETLLNSSHGILSCSKSIECHVWRKLDTEDKHVYKVAMGTLKINLKSFK